MFDVVVKSATLAYGERTVFENLNLTLNSGEWTCLLGGSGVGKTSLLRFIAGLSTAQQLHTSGSVLCSNHLPLKGRIAWMAQQDSLLPWFNVLENVTLGARLRGHFFKRHKLSHAERQKAESILSKVGLANKANELPQNLSGGQRQRVALARTLMEDKPIVLMDEPFGALDAITRLNLQDLACELLAERTILLITHDPLEALRLGHRIYHLQGSPATLTEAIMPPGNIPRSLDNRELMALQGELLERLRHENVQQEGL